MREANSENVVETEEHYAFTPIENKGKVNVANLAYGEEETKDHIYTVTIENGQATHCSCPAHKYNAGSKHRDAVGGNADVIAVADPSQCSSGHEWCPGPAAIDAESGPEVGDDLGCFNCWMAASEEGAR